jgi:transglutaminase-like putative cysteine protease
MADDQDQKAPAGRITLLAALLALEVSAATAFGRVLQGKGPSFKLAVAAGLSVLLAAALERRNVLLAALVSAAAFLIVAGLLVFPDTTRLWLPTLSTLRAIRTAFGAVGPTANVQPAPAMALPPLMVAALTGVWAAAFSSHALAARARSPLLAVIPPAALLAFTNLVMNDGARPVLILPFLASVMGLLFADGLWRVGQWGPITMWHGRRSARLGATTTRGARRVALACLGIAIFAPGLLPGFRSPGLVKLQGQRSAAPISINPIVDIRAQLLSNPDVQVFTVRTNPPEQAAYWRIAADDVFNGRQWLLSDPSASRGSVVDGPAVLPSAGQVLTGSFQFHQYFQYAQFLQPQLPAAFQPISVNVPEGRIQYDARSSVLFDPHGTHPGYSYDVTSTTVVPSPDQLDNVVSMAGPDVSFYTKLPGNTPREIFTIAHQITDNEPTIYRKILALQNYLRNFRYSLNVPPGHSSNDILRFLTVTKAGYCEQFAGSMAVLLRALGIPARVAVGFTSGTYDTQARVWRVRSQDAHAWVEVMFPEFGWLAFEPTPGRANPLASYTTPAPTFFSGAPGADALKGITFCNSYILPGRGIRNEQCTPGPQASTSPGSATTPTPGQEPRQIGGGRRGQAGGRAAPTARGRRWVLFAILGFLGLVVLAVPSIKLLARRLAIMRAAAPRERVLAAYGVLAGQAGDLGVGRRPDETLTEYRTRLKERMALNGDLDSLTALTGLAVYGRSVILPDQADQAMSSARRLTRQIRKSAGTGRQIAGWFRVEVRSRR